MSIAPRGAIDALNMARVEACMMKNVVWKVACVASVFVLFGAMASAQQRAQPALVLQATGTFDHNGTFAGTLTINRFEQRGNQIVAVGFVRGTLARPNGVMGSALTGEVAVPVTVTAGGVVVANKGAGTAEIRSVRWSEDQSTRVRMHLAQATECAPLTIGIGATNVNLLGVDVALDPVRITAIGQTGTPLGDLVCAAADLVGNVAGLVNLLNRLLGALTGLAGGVV
jgi:hypothetical protein